ncbi:hypothetical protein [Robiginitalea aurantiaca]|uniref:Uncharacterized protein n=1 Tax=Robiginitalea aurantiaca TaxID=3056915 RepID=A0ABT7WGA9_9FLAO|nr:hypothetical protein [Robiginitalea aurantiaca]MDM9631854.1 hypothetical protein [Robiginitalea aurantiaca]
MENTNYNTNTKTNTLKASKETVDFLLDFSRSYSVVETGGLIFERNLN